MTLALSQLALHEGRFEPHDAVGVVEWAVRTYGADLRIACSGSIEDSVVVALAARAAQAHGVLPRVFILDTGRLHPETYEVTERLRERYALPVDIYFPQHEAVEQMVSTRGPNAMYRSLEDRHACCDTRKVEPLRRALAGSQAWLTGMRRAQSLTRSALARFAIDDAGRVKLAPLALWEDERVWAVAQELDAVVHPLHERGYPQIGCAPCTRAVAPGEDARAGRWWWEDATQKECGLHDNPKRLAHLASQKNGSS